MRKLLVLAMIFSGVSAEAGTVGWWRMEGTVGENAATVENAANPGTLDAVWNSEASPSVFAETFSPTLTNAAANGSSASIVLGGSSSNMHTKRFNVTDADGLLRPQSFTLEAFCRWDKEKSLGADATAGLVGYTRDSVISCSYGIGIKGNTVIARLNDGADRQLAVSNKDPQDGRWHHLALTYDGTTRTATLWFDYVSCATLQLTGDLAYVDGKPFCIGCFGGRGWIGWVDEVRLSDCALDADGFLDARLSPRCFLNENEPAETLYRYRMGDAVELPAAFAGADETCGWLDDLPDDMMRLNLADWRTGKLSVTTSVDPSVCGGEGDTPASRIRYAAGETNDFADAKSVSFADAGAYKFTLPATDTICGGDFTAELFVRTTARQSNTGLLRQVRGAETDVTWQIGLRDGGGLVFSAYLGQPNTYEYVSIPVEYADGLWHHVAAVYRAATTNVTVYCDGEQLNSATLQHALTEFVGSGQTALIGRKADGFDGQIDEVRVTARALEPSEFLATDYQAMPKVGMLAHYGFDGTWAADPRSEARGILAAAVAAYDEGQIPVLVGTDLAGKFLYGCGTNKVAETFWSTNAQYVAIDKGRVTMLSDASGRFRRPQSTVEAFVRFPAQSELKRFANVLVLEDGIAQVWTIRVDAGNQLYVLFDGTSSIFHPASDARKLNDGRWHHLALTLNQLDAGTAVKLYVDGEAYAAGTAPGAIPFQNSTDTLRLHAASNNGDNFQAFDLDEVRYTARVKEPEDFIAFGKYFDRPGFLLLFK